jgi:hypothetical protein
MRIYLIGSLKDPQFELVADALRDAGHEVFDDWRGAGADGDARWRRYELNERSRGYIEAVFAPFATQGREFDRRNIVASDVMVAVCKERKLPGSSSVAELAYASLGLNKPAYVLLNGEPDEWDLMLPLLNCTWVSSLTELVSVLRRYG